MMEDKEKRCYVGLDLGATKMLAVACDSDLKILGREKKKTHARDGVEKGMEEIVNCISAASEEVPEGAALTGIGITVPGVLDLNDGVVLDTPNLGWRDVPIRKILEKRFNCSVVVLNDVDAGLYGEYRAGCARDSRCALGVFPGTGIGGACVYDGTIIRGGLNSCMEIGHVQVVPEGPLCGCGARGCLEAVASRLAISAAAAQAAYRGEAPNLLADVGMDLSNIKSKALKRSVKAGDKAVETVIRDAAAWIGVAVAGAVNLLAPDVVVLGGGLVEAMPDIFVDVVGKTARKRVMRCFEKSFDVRPAKLGDDATALGAAAWAMAAIEN